MLLNCGAGEDSYKSPLESKEIKPKGNPKGNQPWIFIGKTDAEAEALIHWPPDMKRWLIGKDPDAGKDWGQEEKGATEGEMVGWHHRLNGHGFEWTPGYSEGQGSRVLQYLGSQILGHHWATEKQQSTNSKRIKFAAANTCKAEWDLRSFTPGPYVSFN